MEKVKNISEILLMVRNKNPLVHHITNYVSANDCANITLAIGASPVMADDINEVYDVVSLASVLVINLGTLNSNKLESMLRAGRRANELKIPVVFDPVGAGSSVYRTKAAQKIIEEVKLSAIRGNLSEIKILSGVEAKNKGVDSADKIDEHGEEINNEMLLAMEFAKKLNSVIAVTGAVDVVTDGINIYALMNGHELMSRVTGTGCMCTSLIGSCIGTGADAFDAVLAGVAYMGIAGENAYDLLDKNQEGTGSFRIRLMDSVFKLSKDTILKNIKIRHIHNN